MSKIGSAPGRKSKGLWPKTIDNALRSNSHPVTRVPLPTDIMRIVVDMILHDGDKSTAYTLGLVSKSFRTWVLQCLYEVVIFTSPAHVEQLCAVAPLAGALAQHVQHISLVGLEMHIYGPLDRQGGLYQALENFLADCGALKSLLYDFKRVPLPLVLPGPHSLTQVHWSHRSLDGWRGYEAAAMQRATHLRVDCAQNDAQNARTFDGLLSSCPALTHLSFGVDARMRVQDTAAFVRGMLRHPVMTSVVVMIWNCNLLGRLPLMERFIGELSALNDPRVCVLLSLGAPDEVSGMAEWEDVAHGGLSLWHKAEIIMDKYRLRERRRTSTVERDLAIGSIIYPTNQPFPHVIGYMEVPYVVSHHTRGGRRVV